MKQKETRKPSMFMRESRQLARYPYGITIAALIVLSIIGRTLSKMRKNE